MKPIVIDWPKFNTREDFYASVLSQMEAPGWHGHNLDALQDSWVTGGICHSGPPFDFAFHRCENAKDEMKEFLQTVAQIAHESVSAHGGRIRVQT